MFNKMTGTVLITVNGETAELDIKTALFKFTIVLLAAVLFTSILAFAMFGVSFTGFISLSIISMLAFAGIAFFLKKEIRPFLFNENTLKNDSSVDGVMVAAASNSKDITPASARSDSAILNEEKKSEKETTVLE